MEVNKRARIPGHTTRLGHLVLPTRSGPRELCRKAATANIDAIVASVPSLLVIARIIEQVDIRAGFRAQNAQSGRTRMCRPLVAHESRRSPMRLRGGFLPSLGISVTPRLGGHGPTPRGSSAA